MRSLVVALALLSAPAIAQASPESGPVEAAVVADDVDPALVGAWSLDEVVEGGRLAVLGVAVEDMTCAFGAEGTARIEMEMVQDLDPIVRERTFTFQTENGQIVVPDDDAVAYRMLDDGRLEMTTTGGLVVRFVRSRS
ncbi:hypothetical protein [Rubrivirga sp. IMCC43871]|uniref:hypothetical protein n=1 Tax=Rubrivirga sp. IMCC43871 TaxID=3391575 RepID=UPI00398F9775